MEGEGTHWVVRLNRRNRSLFFALLLLGLIPHLLEIQAGLPAWMLLVVHLLLYPQLAYLCARRADDPLQMEMRSLRLDGFLFGLWIAAWGFPMWISFAMALSVTQNVVIFEGMRGMWKALVALVAGVAVGFLAFDPSLRPEANPWTSMVCMVGLAVYMLVCANYAYQRGVSLRESRWQLGERLAQITALQSQLEELARRDPLTGTYNRRYLDQALTLALGKAQVNGRPLSLLLIDIDHFKRINDTFGHPAGDRVICHLADLLRRRFAAEGDVVCRYGGEEFLVVLPGIDMAAAMRLAEQLRVEFAAEVIEFGGDALRASLSAGIAGFPEHAARPGQLVRLADQALYSAKQAGRNRVVASTDTGAMTWTPKVDAVGG